MSTLLKATATLTRVGAKVAAVLHAVADKQHSVSLEVHDRAFTAVIGSAARKHARHVLRSYRQRERHFKTITDLSEGLHLTINGATQSYERAMASANDLHDQQQTANRAKISEAVAYLSHLKNAHSEFRK